MAKCRLCQVAVTRLHKFDYGEKASWVCTACNSRLNNGKQLGRDTSLTRFSLLMKLAYVVGNLATLRGRQLLLGNKKK